MRSDGIPNCVAVGDPGCALGEIHHVPADGRKTEMSVRPSPSTSNGVARAGAWLTVIDEEPTSIVADLGAGAVCAGTVKAGGPFPLCGCDVIWIQLANVDPIQEHA